MKKFDKNYTNFIQMYSILNNKESTYPDYAGVDFIYCDDNCIFYEDKCTLYSIKKNNEEIKKYLQNNLSKYTPIEKLTYLLQAHNQGIL